MSECEIFLSNIKLKARLSVPPNSATLILFVHGSGSNRFSLRNSYLSRIFNSNGIATLLVDLLTDREKEEDEITHSFRFRTDFLCQRLVFIANWIASNPLTQNHLLCFFSSSTGSAAAIMAATKLENVRTVISRGGRFDLLDDSAYNKVKIPILFIVGGKDKMTLQINQKAIERIPKFCMKKLIIIRGASHFFEEEGKLEEVSLVSLNWLKTQMNEELPELRKFAYYHRFKLPTLSLPLSISWKFRDREAAGNILASYLRGLSNKNPVILGIARGGYIVANYISQKLTNSILLLLLCRRLTSPFNSEIALGAIAQDGSIYLNDLAQNIPRSYLETEIKNKQMEIHHQLSKYGLKNVEQDLINKTVILVDDGAHTGSTLIAAVNFVKTYRPHRIVIALPVAPRHTKFLLKGLVDEIKIVQSPRKFNSVEDFYKDFKQTDDEEIIKILKKSSSL